MSTINANEYTANTQLVSDAIDKSKATTSIVTIEANEDRYAGVCDELATECEDSVEATERKTEYWGKDVEGTEWRVHVTRKA